MALAIWVHRRTAQRWREVERADDGAVTLRAGRWLRLNGEPIWADDHPTTEVHLDAAFLSADYRALDAPDPTAS